MRALPLKSGWLSAGATLGTRYGVEIVARCAPRNLEYAAIRDAVGLTDFSCVRAFRIPESGGIDFLDGLVAGNVARVRFGRVLHTFLATEDGRLAADCYIANNDQELLLLCESILPDAELDALLQSRGASAAGLEDLTGTTVLLGLDGVQAWRVVKSIFGADVLGLPYLSLETYPFADAQIHLWRAGKTSEFGYLLLAPLVAAESLFATLLRETEAAGGRPCGVEIHDDLRLEGRFFNIHAEGRRVGDPLVLGLQWMIDFEKPSFLGSQPILKHRAAGLQRKILGIAHQSDLGQFELGARLFAGPADAGELVATCYSHGLGRKIGLAVAPAGLAYSGLTFRLGEPTGPEVQSISMPPILPKSLGVKLDEM